MLSGPHIDFLPEERQALRLMLEENRFCNLSPILCKLFADITKFKLGFVSSPYIRIEKYKNLFVSHI
jgi:hypothetical protein